MIVWLCLKRAFLQLLFKKPNCRAAFNHVVSLRFAILGVSKTRRSPSRPRERRQHCSRSHQDVTEDIHGRDLDHVSLSQNPRKRPRVDSLSPSGHHRERSRSRTPTKRCHRSRSWERSSPRRGDYHRDVSERKIFAFAQNRQI